MSLSLLVERLRFRKKLREIVQGLAFPPMQLPGMNTIFGRDLRDRFFFLEHFEHHLALEGRGMPCLFRHRMSRVTLKGLANGLVFGDHYTILQQIALQSLVRRPSDGDRM